MRLFEPAGRQLPGSTRLNGKNAGECNQFGGPFPGRSTARSDALQTRQGNAGRVRDNPGQRCTADALHRINETT
jgi:hypothetical protein